MFYRLFYCKKLRIITNYTSTWNSIHWCISKKDYDHKQNILIKFVTTNRSIYNNIIFKDVILYIYIFIETIKNRKSIHKRGEKKKLSLRKKNNYNETIISNDVQIFFLSLFIQDCTSIIASPYVSDLNDIS